MSLQVAVVDPLPMFRSGVEAVVALAGHAVHFPDDVVAWALAHPRRLVILTIASPADWGVLARLAQEGFRGSVVALMEGGDPESGARAIREGARTVLARSSSADMIRRALSAAVDGQGLVPVAVLAALTSEQPRQAGDRPVPSRERMLWLHQLASGSTVAEVAAGAGYSERAMYRLLRSLYRELGADGRVEALMIAQTRGWLTGTG